MNRRELLIAACGALGGGCISTGGNLIVEAQKRITENERLERDDTRRKEESRQKTLEALAVAYDDLGDIPRRATAYAETGGGGNVTDLRAVVRHFGSALRAIRINAATPSEVARYYGGRMRGWAQRFIDLGAERAAGAKGLSPGELYNLRLLGPALAEIAATAVDEDPDMPALNVYESLSNDTMMMSNVATVVNTM